MSFRAKDDYLIVYAVSSKADFLMLKQGAGEDY
jgi:hypothetical protein